MKNTVTIRVSFPAGYREYFGGIFVADRCLVQAHGCDSGAELGEGVVLLSGSVSSDGNHNRWQTVIGNGSVFEVSNVPRPVAEAAVDRSTSYVRVKIVEDDPVPAAEVGATKAEAGRSLATANKTSAILAGAEWGAAIAPPMVGPRSQRRVK